MIGLCTSRLSETSKNARAMQRGKKLSNLYLYLYYLIIYIYI